MQSIIKYEFNEHLIISKKTMESVGKSIEIAAELCIDCLKKGNKILLFGNGGSAADAQHIAAEIVGRYKTERKGLSAIALTTDTSVLTAIGNDYGFDKLFSRQVQANGVEGDVFVGISTSGNSVNIIKAVEQAKAMGIHTIAFCGTGGKLPSMCDITLNAPSDCTPYIQETHISFGHILCGIVEEQLFADLKPQ